MMFWTNRPGVFVQIGAGAGDRDSRAGFEDGFARYVKGLPASRVGRLVLVEPNPVNIPALKECWKDYPQAEFLQLGIRPASRADARIRFYFAEEDGPHFQVFSMDEAHVRAQYPRGTIRSIEVPTVTLRELFVTIAAERIDLLAIDIEGVEGSVLPEVDWAASPCKVLSFEHVHLGAERGAVLAALARGGYWPVGAGLDASFDLCYAKPASASEWVQVMARRLIFQLKGCYHVLRRRRGKGRHA